MLTGATDGRSRSFDHCWLGSDPQLIRVGRRELRARQIDSKLTDALQRYLVVAFLKKWKVQVGLAAARWNLKVG